MSAEQEVVQICVWGFIETRGNTHEVVEAYGNVTEEFAVMDATERALEIGFPPAQIRSSAPILEGSDDHGPFELRTFAMSEVELRGAEELFVEANELADAASAALGLLDAGSPAAERIRNALAAYDRRWGIRR